MMKQEKEEEEEEAAAAVDFFGGLPIDVLRHILSCLTTTSKQSTQPTNIRENWSKKSVYTKQDAQTCILSKTFLHAWSTMPDLNFFHDPPYEEDPKFIYFLRHPDEKQELQARERVRFGTYFQNTLTRYQHHNIPLQTLRLTANFHQNLQFASFLKQWIHKSEEYGVNEIYLDLQCLPYSFDLLSIFSLKKLVSLRLYKASLLTDDNELPINCSSLKTLDLCLVTIHQWLLEKLISSCSLIQQLQLCHCEGLKDIKVSNLPNLKWLEASMISNQTLDVTAPCLELMRYYQSDPSFSYLPSIQSTQNLKGIKLEESTITDGQFHNLIANCPVLEELVLGNCSFLMNIRVSSHSLTFLCLKSCSRLVKVNINAPNLTEFEYFGGHSLPSMAFTSGDFQKRKSSVTLSLNFLKESMFIKLSEFLKSFKRSDIICLAISSKVKISFNKDVFIDLRGDNCIIPEFDQVCMSVSLPLLSGYSSLMEILLASFSPNVLTVVSQDKDFIKYLCEELLLVEDDNPNSSTRPSQSWRNYFKQVKLQGILGKWQPLHSYSWKSMQDVLEIIGYQCKNVELSRLI